MISISQRALNLKQSGIRSATQKCLEVQGINLGQGICDLPTPQLIKDEVMAVLEKDQTKYSACEGVLELRTAIARKATEYNKIPAISSQVMVSHGSAGAFVSAVQTVFNPGDEVILFEPFYGYHKNLLSLFGITVKASPINLEDFSIDFSHLESLVTSKTKGIVICTPCNPCGKVFTREELIRIGCLADKNNLVVISDEIYEYITYPGHEHISFASLADFRKNSITISGFSKTYNMTGWRLGYAIADSSVIEKMSLVQDLLYVCPSTPLQYAVIKAFDLPQSYYDQMRDMYLKKRDFMVGALQDLGFKICVPQGAYYIMADISEMGFRDDQDGAAALLQNCKVATVTGSSFFIRPEDGKKYLRLCYALNQESLAQSISSLKKGLS